MAAAPGTAERPLRVAVVGAGPAGFYTVEALLKRPGLAADVDLYEKLPAPYGLLRYGVAPDHPKIKGVSVAWDRFIEDPRVRFRGNVPIGDAVTVDDLLSLYDQVVLSTGCETDKRLGIPGEDLHGSLSATSFVAWYNGHPEHTALPVHLDVEKAVVVGIGDVAMDLARVLLRDPKELARTDIADYALDALHASRIREVEILARRGPSQSAFAAKELEDIGELPDVAISSDRTLIERDLEHSMFQSGHDRHKLEVLAKLASSATRCAAGRRLSIRFLASPVELVGEERVHAVRVERNELVFDASGHAVARGTGEIDSVEAGLVLRAVGYRGVPLGSAPFDDRSGIVPNDAGRVVSGSVVVPRLYVAGWIKRGATGVVGTNKADAAATVAKMAEDLPSLPVRSAADVSRDAADALLASRGVRAVDWPAWKRIDLHERSLGEPHGRPRRKLTSVEELLKAAGH